MIIEIKGVGFDNVGAHLMLLAIVTKLRKRWPKAELVLHRACGSRHRRTSIGALAKLSLRKNRVDLSSISYYLPVCVRRLLRCFGFVTEADIDLIVDASGFAYSDQWPSALRLWHLSNELLRFKKHGKAYIFLPQAFGPFTNAKNCSHIAESFPYAAMICARDAESKKHIETHTGKIDNLCQYSDFTYLIEGTAPTSSLLNGALACIVPNHNMLDRRNCESLWPEQYETVLIAAIDYYRVHGLTPFFLNHEGAADAALINRLNLQLENPIAVLSESDQRSVKGIIGASKAVLCSRYHGCISAFSYGIPCIGTSWSHKYNVLYAEYGMEELLLMPQMTVLQLHQMIDKSLDVNNALHERVIEHSKVFTQRSQMMWSEFFRVVDQYEACRGAQ